MRIVVFGALAFAADVMSLNLPRFVVASTQPMQTALGEISAP
jgi:hypothetical protein